MQSFDQDSFEEVEDQISFFVGNMLSPRCPIDDVGRFYDDYFMAVRAHAILYLLLDADNDNFHHDLNVVGYARRHLLNRCARKNYQDGHMRSGRTEGFLDVVAASNFDLAREIATLSPPVWGGDDEYEDDFCYGRFLHIYLLQPPSAAADMNSLLLQFEKSLQGDASARLDVCRAFRQGDGDLFTEAFAGLLSTRDGEVKKAKMRTEEFVIDALNTLIFVEGLAILRLAERAGFPTEPDYPGCPALARLTSTVPPPRDPMPPP